MATNSRTLKSNNGLIGKLADGAYSRYRLVCVGSDNRHVKAIAAATDIPTGVLQDGSDAAEGIVSIELLGRGDTKIINMSGAGSKGQYLCPAVDGSGKARVVPATAGAFYVIGQLLEDVLDGEDAPVQDCIPFLAGAQHGNGQLSIPSFAADPTTPIANQFWVNSTDNSLCVYINGAKRTITFLSLLIAFLLAALVSTPQAAAADKTPMVQSNATTGAVAAAVIGDNVKVPGTLEVTGASTFTGAATFNSTITGSSFIGRVSRTMAIADFTDNTNTTGYCDITTQIPAGALVLGWKAVTTTGFTGDTTAVIQVGISGGVGNFSTTTNGSVAGAGTVGSASVLATSFCAAATTARVTVTGGADFTSISAGSVTVTVFYAY